MPRDLVERALGAGGRTGVGKNIVSPAVLGDSDRTARYTTVERWPERLEAVDDLSFLFSSNH